MTGQSAGQGRNTGTGRNAGSSKGEMQTQASKQICNTVCLAAEVHGVPLKYICR